ncbi:MAG: thermonuclease family protein [Ferruginibacter sp.]
MKYIKLILPILFACLTTSAQLVVQVYDGDTYKVLDKGKLTIIRLANVDAPELSQYYGKVVKASVSKLIFAKKVKLDVRRTDRYGRTIADVIIDGLSLDSLLVANGWAWEYVSQSINHELSVYQKHAIEKSKGMWRCEHNVPPWIWRKLNKKQKRLKEMCR